MNWIWLSRQLLVGCACLHKGEGCVRDPECPVHDWELAAVREREQQQRAALDARLAGRARRPVNLEEVGVPHLSEISLQRQPHVRNVPSPGLWPSLKFEGGYNSAVRSASRASGLAQRGIRMNPSAESRDRRRRRVWHTQVHTAQKHVEVDAVGCTVCAAMPERNQLTRARMEGGRSAQNTLKQTDIETCSWQCDHVSFSL
jgi:hypothetical protein